MNKCLLLLVFLSGIFWHANAQNEPQLEYFLSVGSGEFTLPSQLSTTFGSCDGDIKNYQAIDYGCLVNEKFVEGPLSINTNIIDEGIYQYTYYSKSTNCAGSDVNYKTVTINIVNDLKSVFNTSNRPSNSKNTGVISFVVIDPGIDPGGGGGGGTGKSNQTITFNAIANKIYGDVFTLSATSTSNLTVTFSVVSGPAVLNGNQLTIGGTGSVIIQADQSGNTNFNPAPSVQQSFTASPRPITITADAKSKIYGDADPSLTYQITSGSLINSDAPTGTLSRVAGENIGTYSIQQNSLNFGSKYSITYNSNLLTIGKRNLSINVVNKTKIYGTPDPELTYTIVSGSLASGSQITLSRSNGETVNGSPYIISGIINNAENYNFTISTGTLTINTRQLQIIGIFAEDKAYDGTTVASLMGTAALSGVVASDNVTLTGTPTANFSSETPAINKVVSVTGFSITGADVTNYTLAPLTLSADIFKAIQTINFAAISDKSYGDVVPLTATATSNLPVTYTVTQFTGELSGNSLIMNGVGSITVRAEQLGNNNYEAAPPVERSFRSNARRIVVNIDAVSKVYGDADPELTYTIVEGSLAFDDKFNLNRAPGETVEGAPYVINVILDNEESYNTTINSADFVIEKRELNVFGLIAENKIFDGTTDVTLSGSAILTGIIGSDDVTLIGTPQASFADETAGNNKTVIVTGLSLAGADASNYILSTITITANVEKANQNITFDAITEQFLEEGTLLLTANATSDLDVTFEIVNGPATVSGNVVAFNDVGTVTVRASQAGNDDYLSATPVEQSFDIITITGRSIEERLPIVFYPNPVSDYIQISVQPTIVEIIDLTGKLLMRETASSTIDVSELTPGNYLIRIETTNETVVRHFIKQ